MIKIQALYCNHVLLVDFSQNVLSVTLGNVHWDVYSIFIDDGYAVVTVVTRVLYCS